MQLAGPGFGHCPAWGAECPRPQPLAAKQEVTVPASARFLRGGDLTYVVTLATLITAFSIVPGSDINPVPLTLQTVSTGLVELCLDPWRGFASIPLYLLVGATGLPISAKGGAGLVSFVGPTGGYLTAFPLAALPAEFVAVLALKQRLSANTPVILFLGLLAGRYPIIPPLGVFGLMRVGRVGFGKAPGIDTRFQVGDVAGSVIVVVSTYTVRRVFPCLLAQR